VCNGINEVAWYGDTLFVVSCSQGDVLRSTDLGVSWHFATNGLPGAEPLTVHALPTGLFISTALGLYRSVDGGDQWSYAGNGLPDPSSWVPSGEVMDLAAYPPYTFLCTKDAVFVSDAAHDVWTDISAGLPDLSELYAGSLLVKDDTLYFGTNGLGVYKLGVEQLALTVPDAVAANTLVLHPNPADDVLWSKGAALRSLEMTDATGRSQTMRSLGNGRYDVKDLAPGVYLVRGITLEGVLRKGRMVVQ
jgi:hypothetical protein